MNQYWGNMRKIKQIDEEIDYTEHKLAYFEKFLKDNLELTSWQQFMFETSMKRLQVLRKERESVEAWRQCGGSEE